MSVIASALWSLVPLVPHPVDAHGWALRTRGHLSGPYLVGEEPDWHRFEVILINRSTSTRPYPPLRDAWLSGELDVSMAWEKEPEEAVQGHFHPLPRRRGDLPAYLRSGERDSAKFTLRDFGYWSLPGPGNYEARVSFKTPQGTIASPSWTFDVVDIPDKDVLDSHTVPLVGFRANLPPDDQERITVQQVELGDSVLLVWRRFYGTKLGGKVASTARICKLPAKVEMTVVGEYGELGPITIKCKDKRAPTGITTVVIRSVDGRPWTVDYQRWLENRWRRDGGPPHIAPVPRPVKP
jgi:hypothetical protein